MSSNMRSITKFSIATGELKFLFGPLIISMGDMLKRISKETDFRYSQRIFSEGYPHVPGVDLERLQQTALLHQSLLEYPEHTARLRQSLLSADNPVGRAFEAFKRNLIRQLPIGEVQLLEMAFLVPPQIRIYYDVAEYGTVNLLRDMCDEAGHPVEPLLSDYQLFWPLTSWAEAVPIFDDFFHVMVDETRLDQGIGILDHEFEVFLWLGPDMESVLEMCHSTVRVPYNNTVDIVRPFYVRLFDVLWTDAKVLIQRITSHWWNHRDVRVPLGHDDRRFFRWERRHRRAKRDDQQARVSRRRERRAWDAYLRHLSPEARQRIGESFSVEHPDEFARPPLPHDLRHRLNEWREQVVTEDLVSRFAIQRAYNHLQTLALDIAYFFDQIHEGTAHGSARIEVSAGIDATNVVIRAYQAPTPTPTRAPDIELMEIDNDEEEHDQDLPPTTGLRQVVLPGSASSQADVDGPDGVRLEWSLDALRD